MERKRILICDDEAGVHDALTLLLENDYDIDHAFSGNEAIEKASNNNFDGILLDLKMPEKDGIETLEELKIKTPETKVIIVTGYNTVETARRAIASGALDYITKPFDEDEVREKVGRI